MNEAKSRNNEKDIAELKVQVSHNYADLNANRNMINANSGMIERNRRAIVEQSDEINGN